MTRWTSVMVGVFALYASAALPGTGQDWKDLPGPPPAIVVGQVTGARLDEPLGGAMVYVHGQDFAAVTDSLGLYALPLPPGAWIVSVYHARAAEMGLANPPTSFLTLTDGARIRVDFALDPAQMGSQQRPYVMEALEVMVSGSSARRRWEVGANLEVLDPGVLASRIPAARDIGDVIDGQFSGIRVSRLVRNEVCVRARRSSMIRRGGRVARGACDGRVAVVLDGVILVDPGPTLEGLAPDAVTRVEYLPAMWASTEWGARGANGVLFIWTKGGR